MPVHPGFVLLRDHMPVWIDLRVSQDGCHTIFEPLGNEVFQALGFLVHFVPGVLQDVVQKQFEQSVMPDQLPCASFAGSREPHSVVFLVKNHGRALRRQPLQHSRNRGSTNAEPTGERICGHGRVFRPAQLEDAL